MYLLACLWGIRYLYSASGVGGLMADIHDFSRHPRNVLGQIRAYAADLTKVEYQTASINPLLQNRLVLMADIWECLEAGEIMDGHLHFEENGTYAKMVCHTSDGTIFVDILMNSETQTLRVLYAEKEEG